MRPEVSLAGFDKKGGRERSRKAVTDAIQTQHVHRNFWPVRPGHPRAESMAIHTRHERWRCGFRVDRDRDVIHAALTWRAFQIQFRAVTRAFIQLPPPISVRTYGVVTNRIV